LHEKVRAAQVDASTLAHEYQTKFQEQQVSWIFVRVGNQTYCR